MNAREAAHLVIEDFDDDVALPLKGVGVRTINPDSVNELTDAVMDFTAELISSLINAGSERDAVLENDNLRNAIAAELKGWV